MDKLTFIAELTKALAWPVAVGTLVCAFRKPILRLIQLTTKVKFGDLELSFDKELAQVEIEAANLASPSPSPSPSPSEAAEPEKPEPPVNVVERAERLAEISARAAIADVWWQVEQSISRAAARHGIVYSENARDNIRNLGNVISIPIITPCWTLIFTPSCRPPVSFRS
jgi:hypothetical protein